MEILVENVQNRCCDGCLQSLNLPIRRRVRPSSLKSSNQKKSSGRGKLTGMSPIELFTVNSSPAREIQLVSNMNKKSSNKKRGIVTEDSNLDLSLSPSNCGSRYYAINKQLAQVQEDTDQENLLQIRNSYDLEQTYGAQPAKMELKTSPKLLTSIRSQYL
jgi:hypothetical protein